MTVPPISESDCAVTDCAEPIKYRRWCVAHYMRWWRHGDPLAGGFHRRRGRPLAERFWEKVDASGDCWLWTSTLSRGYGTLYMNGTRAYAHRLAWELLVGSIPDGLEVDHLCRVRHCVNPDHLEPVTTAENIKRRDLAKMA